MVNVGGAVRRFDLPPIAAGQLPQLLLIHRNRGQAPSHIWFVVFLQPQSNLSNLAQGHCCTLCIILSLFSMRPFSIR